MPSTYVDIRRRWVVKFNEVFVIPRDVQAVVRTRKFVDNDLSPGLDWDQSQEECPNSKKGEFGILNAFHGFKTAKKRGWLHGDSGIDL